MLQRSLHGGVAVAAAWAALEAAWVRGTAGEAPARGRRAVGRRVGASAKQMRSWSWPGRRRPARRGSVAREAEQAGWGRDRDLNAISKNFRGITVKQG